VRLYRGEDDYRLVQDLLRDNLAAGNSSLYLTPSDLDFWRAQEEPDGLDTMALWFDADDKLIGFAWPTDTELDFVSHHAHRHIEGQMLDWGARDRVDCMAGDEPRRVLLSSRGYAPTGEGAVFFEFRGEVPERPDSRVEEGGSAQLLVEIQPHLSFTEERYDRMRAMPGCLCALTVEAAAMVVVWYDQPSRTGLLEPLGCRASHRRRGLTSALLREALRRLQHADRTLVQAALSNHAAQALHASLGFQPIARKETWCREPRPGS
jgi:ribosomal protein S18 acetylase RimI-like enzyme